MTRTDPEDAGPDDGPAPREVFDAELTDAPERPGEEGADGSAPVPPEGPSERALGDDLDALVEQVGELDGRVAQLTDQLARARADYENLQRRVARDADLERQRARARVLEGFLQVFEYGQMAAQEAERHPGPLAEGVKMVVREFERLLEREGVEQFGAVGEVFDPGLHEGVAEEPGDAAPGTISRVVQPGYRLGDRVLRYAKVAVAPA